MTNNVFPSRKVSRKGQVTIPKKLIEGLAEQVSSEALQVTFTGEYHDGRLSKIIIEAEDNIKSGYNLQKRIDDWKLENGYSETKAREVIKESMEDYEEFRPIGKELWI